MEEEVVVGDGTVIKLLAVKVGGNDDDAEYEPEVAVMPSSRDDKGIGLLERARSAWGSTAGAGSDFFHVYRKQRAREQDRLDKMESDYQLELQEQDFQRHRVARIQQAEAKRVKKRAKKQKQQQFKKKLACA